MKIHTFFSDASVREQSILNLISHGKLTSIVSFMLLQVGYIVMMDQSTRTRTQPLRMRGAGVVGVYHPLIDEKLVKILHGYGFLSTYMLIDICNTI